MMGDTFLKKYDVVILCFLKPRKNEFQNTAATVEELSVIDKIVSNIFLFVLSVRLHKNSRWVKILLLHKTMK